jgi:hypothetical protein
MDHLPSLWLPRNQKSAVGGVPTGGAEVIRKCPHHDDPASNSRQNHNLLQQLTRLPGGRGQTRPHVRAQRDRSLEPRSIRRGSHASASDSSPERVSVHGGGRSRKVDNIEQRSNDLLQRVDKPLCFSQFGGAKSFGKPLINRRPQIACLTDAVPVAQQAGELVAARNSQDNAPCRRAKSSERKKSFSAAAAFDLFCNSRSSPLTRSTSARCHDSSGALARCSVSSIVARSR